MIRLGRFLIKKNGQNPVILGDVASWEFSPQQRTDENPWRKGRLKITLTDKTEYQVVFDVVEEQKPKLWENLSNKEKWELIPPTGTVPYKGTRRSMTLTYSP